MITKCLNGVKLCVNCPKEIGKHNTVWFTRQTIYCILVISYEFEIVFSIFTASALFSIDL